MAFSTPAQKPRGEARRTRSTGTWEGYRPVVGAGPGSLVAMSAPRVVSVAAASPAQRAGLQVGDELLAIDGGVPRDVIEYRLMVDEADPELEIRRGHEELSVAAA